MSNKELAIQIIQKVLDGSTDMIFESALQYIVEILDQKDAITENKLKNKIIVQQLIDHWNRTE